MAVQPILNIAKQKTINKVKKNTKLNTTELPQAFRIKSVKVYNLQQRLAINYNASNCFITIVQFYLTIILFYFSCL